MLELTKAVVNNLNRFKYLKNVDRVEVDSDTNSIASDKSCLEKLNHLQNEDRVTNLEIFAESYLKIKMQRFLFISLPAMLSAVAIGFSCSPNKKIESGVVESYEIEHTLYNSNFGESRSSETVYKDLTFYTIAPETQNYDKMNIVSSIDSSSLKFKVHDSSDYLTATFNLSDEGKLTTTDISATAYYIDLDNEENTEFTSTNVDYVAMYDVIVEKIKNSNTTSSSELEALERLTNEEKKTFIIEISKCKRLDDVEVLVEKNRSWPKFLLYLFAIAYMVIEGIIIYNWSDPVLKFNELNYSNGHLSWKNYEILKLIDLLYAPTKIKEAFLAAEKERIFMATEEVSKNIVASDRGKVLTRYELKLINK